MHVEAANPVLHRFPKETISALQSCNSSLIALVFKKVPDLHKYCICEDFFEGILKTLKIKEWRGYVG